MFLSAAEGASVERGDDGEVSSFPFRIVPSRLAPLLGPSSLPATSYWLGVVAPPFLPSEIITGLEASKSIVVSGS